MEQEKRTRRARIALFIPSPHKRPRDLDEQLGRLYGKNVTLDFAFYWEPPTVEEMRATGICDRLDEACWTEHDTKDIYCKNQIQSLIQRVSGYEYYLFLTTYNPILYAAHVGVGTGSVTGYFEGKHLAIAPFWDMQHILHEVGHLIGLEHCENADCVMYKGHLRSQISLCQRHRNEV
jgi:hypothetical protein